MRVPMWGSGGRERRPSFADQECRAAARSRAMTSPVLVSLGAAVGLVYLRRSAGLDLCRPGKIDIAAAEDNADTASCVEALLVGHCGEGQSPRALRKVVRVLVVDADRLGNGVLRHLDDPRCARRDDREGPLVRDTDRSAVCKGRDLVDSDT